MRHRLEHKSCCTPKQLKRIKDLGVTPSSSIGYMYGLGDQYYENFEPKRSRWLHPHRTMQEMGSIEPGKLADLIVIDRDILSLPPEELLETKVLMTIVDGKTVYPR